MNEILFQAKINPFKKSYLINLEENKRIVKYSKIILKKAIDFGGSSIRDFKGITGKSGNFQSEFKVYDRTKKRCSRNNCSGQISRKNNFKQIHFYMLSLSKVKLPIDRPT